MVAAALRLGRYNDPPMRRDDLLDLNDVLQHPGRKIAVEITTELETEEDLDLLKPLEGELRAISTGNLLLIEGEFTTRLVLECARCGSPTETEVEFELNEQFTVEGVPSSLSSQDMAKVVSDEPYPLFDENNLMVEALLRQNLLVNMPVQALCPFGWEKECPMAKERGANLPVAPAGRIEFQTLADKLKGKIDGRDNG
jgi:uncharacterized metal-binding protein YceD (DUF177 family)